MVMRIRRFAPVGFYRCIVVVVTTSTWLIAVPASADFGDELFKLSASDATIMDLFGTSVAISGTTAIVSRGNQGPPGSAHIPLIPESVYVFDVTTGQQLRKLVNSDAVLGDHFGLDVDISGNTAIIGALFNDTAGTRAGSAYLFDVATGNELFKFTASDAAERDRFGSGVAISGNTAIVGAFGDSHAGEPSGAAYVFDIPTRRELRKLTADDAASGDDFGADVDISGNVAIVGAQSPYSSDNRPGAAYVFNVATGQQLFKLRPSDSAPPDNFGASVAISGNIAIVGAPWGTTLNTDKPGYAYIFDTKTGRELFKLTASDAAAGDLFGSSVAISGNTAIVGAYRTGATDSGSAYVFDVTTGQELLKLNGTGTAPEAFGGSVALDGGMAIIGARSYQTIFVHGAAYVFEVTRSLLPGDFNTDGTVDAADYIVWRNGLRASYTQTDYDIWRANFGRSAADIALGATTGSSSSATPAVPEPNGLSLLALGLISVVFFVVRKL
jgi:hypothetical protein